MTSLKNINSKIIKTTRFIINPCLEFVCAIRIVGDEKNLRDYAKEMNFQIEDKDNELIDRLKEKVSKYVIQELQYFFDIVPVFIYPAAFVADNKELETVEALLEKMEGADLPLVFKYLGGLFIGEYAKGLHEDWGKIDNDIDKMREYIEEADIEEKDKKEKLLEFFRYPEETKQRLCFMFRQFYEKAYYDMESEILKALQSEKDKYIALFNNAPENFYHKYLWDFFNSTDGKWEFKIDIHVSILFQISFWALNMHDYKKKPGIIVLGARMDNFLNKLEINDEVDKFLKVLSDKRRIEIIKLLSEKVYYGYEIANILKLTPATINYHMVFIMEARLISIQREDNKVLYNLDKERVRMLFKETEKVLLKE